MQSMLQQMSENPTMMTNLMNAPYTRSMMEAMSANPDLAANVSLIFIIIVHKNIILINRLILYNGRTRYFITLIVMFGRLLKTNVTFVRSWNNPSSTSYHTELISRFDVCGKNLIIFLLNCIY